MKKYYRVGYTRAAFDHNDEPLFPAVEGYDCVYKLSLYNWTGSMPLSLGSGGGQDGTLVVKKNHPIFFFLKKYGVCKEIKNHDELIVIEPHNMAFANLTDASNFSRYAPPPFVEKTDEDVYGEGGFLIISETVKISFELALGDCLKHYRIDEVLVIPKPIDLDQFQDMMLKITLERRAKNIYIYE